MRRLPITHDHDTELPPCVECGACCNFDDPRYAMVLEEDSERFLPEDHALTHWTAGRCFMRVVDGHCAALQQIEGMSWCTIYERRPQGCRDAARGGPDCHKGLERRAAKSAR
jgi:Fe-S-cluster containining protein